MGEITDMMLENYGWDDDGMGRSDPDIYLRLSDEDLRAECTKARDAKIVSIRDWAHKLSEKQRFCLALWCAHRDDRDMQRAIRPNTEGGATP